MNRACSRTRFVSILVALGWTCTMPAFATPDLEIVGWTVIDYSGNGDGGLHPGEKALLAPMGTNSCSSQFSFM